MSNSIFEGLSNVLNYPLSSTREIHVLLIEREDEYNCKILNMMESFSYKVTAVKYISVALSILKKEKTQVDVVIADVNSCHSYMFHLLQETSRMDILSILMCDENNAATTMRALEHGAFLCAKKPVSQETIEFLWQHVARKKLGKPKGRAPIGDGGINFTAPENEYLSHVDENRIVGNCDIGDNLDTDQNDGDNGIVKRKIWTEWTEGLHEKFMDAVAKLGDGRCYPKEILDLMNIPGLTRMQVASHLQKCRNAKWIPPNKRKSKLANMERMVRQKTKAGRSKTVRFGSMPRLEYGNPTGFRNSGGQQHPENHQEFIINPPMQTNAIVNDNSKGSFGNLYDPQGSLGNSYDSQLLIDNANPFANNHYETFSMVPLSQGLGMDETLMYRVQSDGSFSTNSSTNQIDNNIADQDALDLSYLIQNFSSTQQESGMNYNRSFVQDKVQYQQDMPFGMTDPSENCWGWE